MHLSFSGRPFDVDDHSHSVNVRILHQAQQTGSLNLSNRNLKLVPSEVWQLNDPGFDSSSTFDVDFERSNNDTCWWEIQPISKLFLAFNQITHLSGEGLSKLCSLTHLDLRDNRLLELPNEVEELTILHTLILGSNQLKHLPCGLWNLKHLTVLDVSNNLLESLDTSICNSTNLLRLDLSKNCLSNLPEKLPPNLRQLQLSQNRLELFPIGLLEHSTLITTLDLSSNQFVTFALGNGQPAERNNYKLETLTLKKNRLTTIPDMAGCSHLKELSLSDNRLSTICLSALKDCPCLNVLDLARNQITALPDDVDTILSNLVRLDLSSNNLNSLPTELGLMNNLQVLLIDSNPIKSIRQNVITGGTEAIKSLLRQRHVPKSDSTKQVTSQNGSPPTVSGPTTLSVAECVSEIQPIDEAPQPPQLDDNMDPINLTNKQRLLLLKRIGPGGQLDWSGVTSNNRTINPIAHSTKSEAIDDLPILHSQSEWFAVLNSIHHHTDVDVRSLILMNRSLKELPTGLYAFATTLTSLNLSCNQLTTLPDDLNCLVKLSSLDVSRNAIHTLPSCIRQFTQLVTIRLDYNPLGPELPLDVLFQPPLVDKLTNLYARSCGLAKCPPADCMSPSKAPSLTTVDLSNNSINHLHPELGLCTQLKSLQLEGNSFRVPRPAVLTKGTAHVLEYLRNRIPE